MSAEAFKSEGNAAFAKHDFPAAITAFTKAIELDQSNHVLYSNRSAAHASLSNFEAAEADARKCVELNPTWAKGFARLGAALHGLGRYDEAIEAYDKGLALDGSNTALQEGRAAVEKDKKKPTNPFAKVFGPDTFARIQANPALAPYLKEPDFVMLLNQIIANPTNIQMFLNDKRLMHCFMELSGISLPKDSFQSMNKDEPTASSTTPPPASASSASAGSTTTTTTTTSNNKKKDEVKKISENAEALRLKDEGNELYKQHKFDEAIAKYDEALKADPTCTTFMLNKSAALFEKGDLDKCINVCDEALDHAREHHADFTLLARIMTRRALCLQRQKRYDEAIEQYRKALLEHRNPDTLKKLNECEKEKKKAEEEAYFDPELAKQKKEEGNEYFKKGDYPKAVECYTEAIRRNPKEHTAYSNRAAAYLKLMAYSDALADCEKCLEIEPNFVRAHARKGHAYFWTKQYHRALKAYEEGLAIDPSEANTECREGKMKTMMKIQEISGGDGDEDVAARAMSDPEIQGILGDTYMQLVLSEMQKNPARISEYMADPNIAAKVQKLIAAGILRVGSGPGGAGQGR